MDQQNEKSRKIKAQITFMSDFILYANKINSSKGSHLPAGHHEPSAHFLCRLRRRKVSQYQSATRESPTTLRRDLPCIKFGYILLSTLRVSLQPTRALWYIFTTKRNIKIVTRKKAAER